MKKYKGEIRNVATIHFIILALLLLALSDRFLQK